MNDSRRAALALAATTLAWGSTFVIVRDLVAESGESAGFPPFLLLSIRFALATALMVAIALARGIRVERAALRNGVILGLITTGGFAFQTLGLRYTTSSRSAFITNVSLLLVPIFGLVLGRARPGRALWAGCVVAFMGLYLLEFPWDAAPAAEAGSQNYLFGDLLTIGCAVFFAMQILATESLSPKTPLMSLVIIQFATAAIVGFAFAPVFGELARAPALPGGLLQTTWRILFLGALATGVCLLIQAWAQRYTSATRAALIFMLEPVFATVLAFIVNGERFTFAQWIGAALVSSGVLAAELLSKAGG
ncbi:MAG: DMT family transporter [Planctomycetes bacterium]|nr:DMT family transporter [Planctomycetota bacterium]